jgi:LuxR family quorum sensing-dependent transcriptional regulator
MGILEDDLNALEACRSVAEIRDVFQRIIENYGFSSFGFMDASHPWEDDPLLVSTHSTAWIDTYRSENFISTDPCLNAARRTNLPFHWGSIALPPVTGRRKPGAVRTMEAARDFGINEGLTIPVHYNDALGRRYTSVCALFWKDSLNSFLPISGATARSCTSFSCISPRRSSICTQKTSKRAPELRILRIKTLSIH